MSNLSFLLDTFVGLLALWAGTVLLFLALWPPLRRPFDAMPSMRDQTIVPPYVAEKSRRH